MGGYREFLLRQRMLPQGPTVSPSAPSIDPIAQAIAAYVTSRAQPQSAPVMNPASQTPGQELVAAAWNAKWRADHGMAQPPNMLPAGAIVPPALRPIYGPAQPSIAPDPRAVEITPETAQVLPGEVPNNLFPAISNMPANAPIVANSDLGLGPAPRLPFPNTTAGNTVGGMRSYAPTLTHSPFEPGSPQAEAYQAQLDQGFSPAEATQRVNQVYTTGPVGGTSFTDLPGVGKTGHLFKELLTKSFQTYDKGRQYVQGGEADRLYEYLKVVDQGDYNWAVAHGKIPKNATPEQWKAYQDSVRQSAYGPLDPNRLMGDVAGSPMAPSGNDPIAKYLALSPDERYKYRNEFLAAYENGYRPTKRVEIAPGIFRDEPTGQFFAPGSQAGHEYIASQEGLLARAANDISQDPFLYLLPGADALGKGLVEAGGRVALRGAADEAAAAGAREAINSTAGRALQGAGYALRAPNLFFNAAPDVVIGAPLKAGRAVAGKIPGLNWLLEPWERAEAQKGADSVYNAIKEDQGVNEPYGGVAPRTIIPGVPEAQPTAMVPELDSGSLGSSHMGPIPADTGPYGPIPQPSNHPLTPQIPERSTYSDFEVGPGGDVRPRITPGGGPSEYTGAGVLADAGGTPEISASPTQPVSPAETAAPEVPTRRSEVGGQPKLYVGLDQDVRVVARDNGSFVVQVKEPRGAVSRWVPDAEAPLRGVFTGSDAEQRAVDYATDKVRARAIPEVDTAAPSAAESSSSLDFKAIPEGTTREERNAAIAAGEYTKLHPIEGGNRVIDQAWTLGKHDPAGWSAFKDLYSPAVERVAEQDAGYLAAWKAIGDQLDVLREQSLSKYDANGKRIWMPQSQRDAIFQARGALFDQQKAMIRQQTAESIDHVVDELVPAFEKAYGYLPEVEPVKPRNTADSAGRAVSYRKENSLYLMERAVYTTDEADAKSIFRILKTRGELTSEPGMIDRLAAARTRLNALRAQAGDDLAKLHSGLGGAGRGRTADRAREQAIQALRQRRLQPNPERIVSQSAEETLSTPWEQGEFAGMTARQVQATNLAAASRDQTLYKRLLQDGYSANTLTEREAKEVTNSVTLGKPGRISVFDSSATQAKARLDQVASELTQLDQQIATWQREIRGLETSVADPAERRSAAADLRRQIQDARDQIRDLRTERNQLTPQAKPSVRQTEPTPIEANGNKVMASLELRWGRFGDIASVDPNELAAQKTAWDRAVSIDPKITRQTPLAVDLLQAITYRLPRALLLADPLTSWMYTARNILSNELMSAIDHPWIYLDPQRFAAMKGAFYDVDKSIAGEMVHTLTGGSMPREFAGAADKFDEILRNPALDRGGSPTSRLMDAAKVGGVRRPFDWKRQVDRQIERSMKVGGYFAPMLRAQSGEAISDLTSDLVTQAARRSVPVTESEISDLVWGLRDRNGVFSSDTAYGALYQQAIDAGAVEANARAYARAGSSAWKERASEVVAETTRRTNRVFPSYLNQTRLDHYLSYVTLFHMWPTRATRFLLEEMIRHPQVAAAWYRAHEGMQRYADEHGYPDSVKGLLYLATSPFGAALFANPAALFMVQALLPDQAEQPNPQGVTGLGKALLEIKKHTGLGPVPLIDAVLNMTGVYGNDFIPDIVPSRTADLTLAALDAALVHTGHDMHDPVWDQTMQNARQMISGVMPWSGGVPAGDATGYTSDLIGSMILKQAPELATRLVARDAAGKPTDDAIAAMNEYNAILDNEEDPRYTSAERAVAGQKLFTAMLNLVSPLTIRARDLDRDRAIQTAQGGRALPYADRTEEQQAAIDLRSAETTTPEAGSLDALDAEYRNLGTPRQRSLNAGWKALVYDFDRQPPGSVFILSGHPYSMADLANLTEQERMDLADQWVATKSWNGSDGTAYNATDDLDAFRTTRKDWISSHPEYGSFDEWRSLGYGYDGGVHAFYADRTAGNPNFKKEAEAHRSYLLGKGVDTSVIDHEMDAWSVSLAGYEAGQGIRGSVYDPQPISTGDQATVNTILRSGGGSSGSTAASTSPHPGKSTADKLNADIAAYNKDAALVSGMMQNYGIDPVVLNSNNPYAKDTLSNLFGDLLPKRTRLMDQYDAWKLVQPRGTDTSVEAFGAYLDGLAERQAA